MPNLSTEAEIRNRLSEYYSEEEIEIFLNSKQPLLNDRIPLALIAEGKADRIIAMLNRLDDSVYI